MKINKIRCHNRSNSSLLNRRKMEIHVYPNAQGDENECMKSCSQCETQYLLLEWKIPTRSIQEMQHNVIVLKYRIEIKPKNPINTPPQKKKKKSCTQKNM